MMAAAQVWTRYITSKFAKVISKQLPESRQIAGSSRNITMATRMHDGKELENDKKAIQNIHKTFDALLECENSETLTQTYDKMAAYFDKMCAAVRRFGHIRAASTVIESEPNKNARILDVGCGTGLVGDHLHEAGYHNLYGVDMSKNLLQMADEKRVYNELIHTAFGPDTPLSYENGYFDLAVASECFLPKHLNETHLPEMKRLVKQGGHLVFTLRKSVFDNEEGNMKLKSCLLDLVKQNLLQKISLEDFVLKEEGSHMGVVMCYRILK